MKNAATLTNAQAALLMQVLQHGYEHQMSWQELCAFSATLVQQAQQHGKACIKTGGHA